MKTRQILDAPLEICAQLGTGTYVTDGVVGVGSIRVLASAVVVTMAGDQDCEKEGYCRQGLHGVAG